MAKRRSKGEHRVCRERSEFVPGHGSKSPRRRSLTSLIAQLALGAAMAFGSSGAWAEEPPPDSNVPAPTETKPATSGGESGPQNPEAGSEKVTPPATEAAPSAPPPPGTVDIWHEAVSHQILATAEWLDSFFDDPRFRAENNQTRVKVAADYLWERGTTSDFKFPVSVQLKLPRLQDRARFVVFGPQQQQDAEGQTPASGTAASRLPSAQQTNATTALDYFFWATERLNIATRVGVRLHEGQPVGYVQPRYRQLWKFDPWALRFTEDLKWWTDLGWESSTTFDLERPLSDRFFFRTSLQGAWTEQKKNYYYYSLAFNVRQILSPRRVMQYELVNGFQTDEESLEEIRATVRFREKIWRDWMFFEIAPYASYRRDHDFDFLPGILVRFELIFGRWEGIGL